MATVTVTEAITRTVLASASASNTNRAVPQGGVLEGANPSRYDPKNPIIIFIIQAGIIIVFCRLLHFPLSKLRQPRVIAEVIGGILLGPSVMGRIPGFTDHIFPKESMPNLTLVANLGLVLFLFLVGLEVDLRFLASNWKIALSVGAAGMALPFGLGCAIAWGLYNEFRNDPGIKHIDFGVYMLFIGVAMAITAFPVLCRILTELKLLGTPVGIIVLSAGVGNDVVGWILLALCVALVNAGTGLTALWVLLTCAGYTLFLVFAVRPVFMWILVRTRSIQDGPPQSIIALTLLIALTSSFFTGIIGVHPIFGAFMAGLICPHDGGFAIKVTEKIEDLVSTLFLPLYFALSGLSTNLGLLNSGITWAYVVGVIAIAFFAKVIGGSGAARLNGLVWRECFTIGALMSCKGLVELIVLNIGLQAHILSVRTFTIFVVMALVTTFATTPLVSALYPPWYQKKLEAWKRGEIDWDTGRSLIDDDTAGGELAKKEAMQLGNFLMYMRLDGMPGLLTLISLFGGSNKSLERESVPTTAREENNTSELPLANKSRAISVHGVRLLQLTERDSSVMQVSEASEFSLSDPVVNTFRTFGRIHGVAVSGEVAVVPESYFADTLTSRAADMSSDMLLLPWSETGGMGESKTFASTETGHDNKFELGPFSDFIGETLRTSPCNVGIFVNNGLGGVEKARPRQLSRTLSAISTRTQQNTIPAAVPKQSHHIFMPYFGSADDRVALRLVLQLARDASVTATIVHFKTDSEVSSQLDISYPTTSPVDDYGNDDDANQSSTFGSSPKTQKQPRETTRETISLQERHSAHLASIRASIPRELEGRVIFDTVSASAIGSEVVQRIKSEVGRSTNGAGDLIIAGRNSDGHEGASCLGTLGDIVISRRIEASLLVVQASTK